MAEGYEKGLSLNDKEINMKFNGIEVYVAMGDNKRYANPLLTEGQKIQLLYDDDTFPGTGFRVMKKGIYIVLKIRKGVGIGLVYGLIKDTKNSKYVHAYSTIAIDKAIKLGLVTIVN